MRAGEVKKKMIIIWFETSVWESGAGKVPSQVAHG